MYYPANFSIIDELNEKYNTAVKPEDIIFFAYHIYSKYESIKIKWQKRMQYIMVDEFQDVSKRQCQLVELLSEYNGNLFIVGDPDQMIYSWRGADVKLFLDFDKNHPETRTIILSKNYRSNPPIIEGSNTLIEKYFLMLKIQNRKQNGLLNKLRC